MTDSPFADEPAERAVLAAILLDECQREGTHARISQILRVQLVERRDDGRESVRGDFYNPAHNVIFAAMGAVLARGEDLDITTLADELRRVNRFNAVGGAQYLGEITDAIPTLAHCESHARVVKRLADCRRVDDALHRARAKLRSEASPDDALARALDVLRDGIEKGSHGGPRPFEEYAVEAWNRIEQAARGEVSPLTFGLPQLDDITGGFAPGQVVVVAGPQGRGKTALLAQVLEHNARQFLAHAAERNERTALVQWFSLEMGGVEMLNRHAAWDCNLTQRAIRDGTLKPHELEAVGQSFNARSSLPIHFDGSGDPTALDVRAYVYGSPRTRIVAVDWLGLLRRHPDAPHGAKAHELAELNMKTLKALARQRHVALIVLNQYTQEGNRHGKPSLHDMLGGAAVANNCDVALLMHADKEIGGTVSPVTIRVEKARGSQRGLVETLFDSKRGTFHELVRPVEDEGYHAGGWPPAVGDAE